MEIKVNLPDFAPKLDDFLKHMKNAQVEVLEAMKALTQARINQLKGKKGSTLKRIEVK